VVAVEGAVLAGELGGFQREARVWDARRRLEWQSGLGEDRQQPVVVGDAAAQVAAALGDLGVQLEGAPLHLDIELAPESVDAGQAEVAPGADVVRDNGDAYVSVRHGARIIAGVEKAGLLVPSLCCLALAVAAAR
jgi:hypothetical protein